MGVSCGAMPLVSAFGTDFAARPPQCGERGSNFGMDVAAARGSTAMKSALSFLVAARECEIGELEQLAVTSELVSLVGRLIHALQKERGISNVFLGSQGKRFGEQRAPQALECDELARQVRERFDELYSGPHSVRNGARLFARIAAVLHGLDELPGLRERIGARTLGADESTEAFARLISGLLAVVFEAADSASDPQVSRALVAMFNFMQGKEFAGRARAFGAMVFVGGRVDDCEQRWQQLIDTQERCFQVFTNFADPAALQAWSAQRNGPKLAELDRLRQVGRSARERAALDPRLGQDWYDCCTHRIDAMRKVEDTLASHLRALCERRIEQTRAELRDQQAILATLSHPSGPQTTAPIGPQLERSILDMLQEQSSRLQAMSDELDTVRASLNERKVVERAKGLLMAARTLSEDAAYKVLREAAMNQSRRLVDVAERIVEAHELLGPKA